MVMIPDPSAFGYNLKRYFYEGTVGQAPGTYWTLWGGHISADHVYTEQNQTVPPFAQGNVLAGGHTVDACLIGCDAIPSQRPREPERNERIFVYGYPGGSNEISPRIAEVYIKRQTPANSYETPTWVAKIAEWPDDVTKDSDEGIYYEPVRVGMSGGLIMSEAGEALGILVGDSGPWHEDADGDLDQVLDFVALADVWDVLGQDNIGVLSDSASVRVRVDRFMSDDLVTLSRIYLNDRFICHGLEDAFQPVKIPGKTRIPAGKYDLGARLEGGFHARYSDIFSDIHRGMLHIKNVPNFEFILIHTGNYHHDTEGCLLVGNADVANKAVWSSRATYRRIYVEMIDAALNNDATIEFVDLDLN